MKRVSAALPIIVGFFIAAPCAAADDSRYAGAQVCASCHQTIAATQIKTAMAQTWYGSVTPLLPDNYIGRVKEGTAPGIGYEIAREKDRFLYSVTLTNGTSIKLPVEVVMGGHRHGLSFLARIDQVDGIPLERASLIEARYVFNTPHNALAVSPGFSTGKPDSYEAALGEVLSPSLETKCITCHGKPGTLGAGTQGGVHCESCHDPGMQHVKSGGKSGMANPKTFTAERSMQICAQCHIGFSDHSDPLPQDLLVSNQVTALKNSECFIQSGNAVACTSCHDPHADSTQVELTAVNTCLGCHSAGTAARGAATRKHASVCPVNAAANCLSCHMPKIPAGVFSMSDHWIRVHPEQGVKAPQHPSLAHSDYPPLREFLRIVVTDDSAKAQDAAQRIASGEPFGKVAHDVSLDATAPGGGYVGETWLADLSAPLAAAAMQLKHGETSPIIPNGGRFVILQRMPRDFKYDADLLFQEATKRKLAGDVRGALQKDQESLAAYPFFLRALTFMGATLGEAGDLSHAAEVLTFAAQQYPKDAPVQFNLGLILGGLGRGPEQMAALRRAIALDPDSPATYENLGAALYAQGDWQGAIEAFRQGLQADPLSPKLNFNLSLALGEHGDKPGAERAHKLAVVLDPLLSSK